MRLVCVVLNYGTPDATISTVRSIKTGTSPFGVVIVDNASPDASVQQFRSELPDVQIVVSSANHGFSAGCNLGIQEAMRRGAECVLILNSDVRLASEAVAALDHALASDVGIAGPLLVSPAPLRQVESAGVIYSDSTGRMRHRFAGVAHSTVASDVADVDAVSGCAMLVRREVFETIGLLAEEFFYGFEDLEFCLRAKAAGFRIVCAGSAVVKHEGAASIGRSSPRRLYFAARNHLLLASRVGPQAWPIRTARAANIVGLNVAHALFRSPVPVGAGLAAVSRGVRDHWRGKYGADEPHPT